MSKSFTTITGDVSKALATLRKEIPDTMQGFNAMAKGALARSDADVAVAISGVAGPGGGTQLKPVGTVVFAKVVRGQEGEPEGELKSFEPTSRAGVRREATLCALELLLP